MDNYSYICFLLCLFTFESHCFIYRFVDHIF